MHVCLDACRWILTSIQLYMHPYIYDACIHTYMYKFRHICLHIYHHTHVNAYTFMNFCLHKYGCQYIPIYIQTHIQEACLPTHMHIQ